MKILSAYNEVIKDKKKVTPFETMSPYLIYYYLLLYKLQ